MVLFNPSMIFAFKLSAKGPFLEEERRIFIHVSYNKNIVT